MDSLFSWTFLQVARSSLTHAFQVLDEALAELFQKDGQEFPLASLIPLISNMANQDLLTKIIVSLSKKEEVFELVSGITNYFPPDEEIA